MENTATKQSNINLRAAFDMFLHLSFFRFVYRHFRRASLKAVNIESATSDICL